MAAFPNLVATRGLLELYHVHQPDETRERSVSTGNTPHLGFQHPGFTVPDVQAAVERLREAGVTIRKEIGECSRESIPLSEWEAERGIGRGEIHANYAGFFEQFAMEEPMSETPREINAGLTGGWIFH